MVDTRIAFLVWEQCASCASLWFFSAVSSPSLDQISLNEDSKRVFSALVS